jgi:stage II sporulation protein GA (sporulation sigma-E factor processing peptidase)
MFIYAEYAILDNIVINAILLWFTFRTIKQRVGFFKIFTFVTVGLALAVLLPVMSILLFINFKTQSFTLAIFVLMATKAVVTLIFLYSLTLIIKFLHMREKISTFMRAVTIECNNEKFNATGFVDSGNSLVDPQTNAPVVIITMSLFLKIFPQTKLEKVYLNKLDTENIALGHYINFSTVGKSGKMFVFSPTLFSVGERARGEKCAKNVMLGVSMSGFSGAVKYDALLNVAVL